MGDSDIRTDTRRAAYLGNRQIAVANDGVPGSPGPAEVRIAVAYTGICGTDLHILHGAMDKRVSVPAVIGHEMSGRIAATGSDVTDWKVGDHVTVMPLEWCGQCAACRRGHSHVCQRLNFLGIDTPGSMQSSWTIPARLLVRLPPQLPLHLGALAEPTAVAVHDVRRGAVAPGEKAVVVGGGPVGVLIALTARSFGADVVVLEPDKHRRTVAASVGLTAYDPSTINLGEFVDEWTSEAGADVAFEVSGSAAGVFSATHVLGVHGRLVMVAIHPKPREVDLFHIFWRELTVLGARVYQRQDFETAVDLIAQGRIPVEALISRIMPMDDVSEAFALLEKGAAMKVLIDCGSA
jgi:2-desacetyl-2-hydroxyethyl bacteriochlorophyllide A dehydrogenase